MGWWGRPRVRPRYGQLLRANGAAVPLVFHPSGEAPEDYEARYADSYEPVVLEQGDSLSVDQLGEGQSVLFGAAGHVPDTGVLNVRRRPGPVRRLLGRWRRALGLW